MSSSGMEIGVRGDRARTFSLADGCRAGGRRASDWGLRSAFRKVSGMGRLALDLPAVLGRDCEDVYGRETDRATERFVRWFDCWARAGR